MQSQTNASLFTLQNNCRREINSNEGNSEDEREKRVKGGGEESLGWGEEGRKGRGSKGKESLKTEWNYTNKRISGSLTIGIGTDQLMN